jgi:hypothetical protein
MGLLIFLRARQGVGPPDITSSSSWVQAAASWSATVTPETTPEPPIGAATITGRARAYVLPKKTKPAPVLVLAAFIQPAPQWSAVIEVRESEDWLLGIPDESTLVLV